MYQRSGGMLRNFRTATLVLFCWLLTAFVSCRQSTTPTLHISASSSLTEVFEDLKKEFILRNPGTNVVMNFAGSQVLRLQWEHGANADLFASADKRQSLTLRNKALLGPLATFATNELVVVVRKKLRRTVRTWRDLSKVQSLVVGIPEAPIGRYTERMFQTTSANYGPRIVQQWKENIVSREKNVRLVRAKVELGHVDAAIVYKTDALSAKSVYSLPLPPKSIVRARYSIGIHPRSRHPRLARKWLQLLRSKFGRRKLRERGFGIP